jgi:hypothetical protein
MDTEMQQAAKNMMGICASTIDAEMQRIAANMLDGIAMSYGIPTGDHEYMMRCLEAKKGEETDAKKKKLLELATDQLVGLDRAMDIQNVMLLMAGVVTRE